MPFGRFRGCLVEELPDAYLRWLLSITLTSDVLREAVEEEAEDRGFFRRSESLGRAAPSVTTVDELVGAGLRAMAKRHHPDVGGDPVRMKAYNLAADWLRRQARALA